jgi:hypothetical protein
MLARRAQGKVALSEDGTAQHAPDLQVARLQTELIAGIKQHRNTTHAKGIQSPVDGAHATIELWFLLQPANPNTLPLFQAVRTVFFDLLSRRACPDRRLLGRRAAP